MIEIVEASSPAEIAVVRELLLEYQEWLGFDLAYQGFQDELASLPGKYAPPRGSLLLAYADGVPAGMIAMRPLDDTVCEMKRLYVRPLARGQRLGHALIARVPDAAVQAGFTRMRLDTVAGKMDRAIAIYRELGFYDIDPYYSSPVAHTTYLEKDLSSGPS